MDWIAALFFTTAGANILRIFPTDVLTCKDNQTAAYVLEQEVNLVTGVATGGLRISKLDCVKASVSVMTDVYSAPTKTVVK